MGTFLWLQESTAPGRVPCKKSEMFDYPSGFLPRQKATSPDKGRHGCGANPGDGGRCGGRGEVGGRLIAAPTRQPWVRRMIAMGYGRFVRELRYDCHRQSFRFRIRCALQHAPTPTERRASGRPTAGSSPARFSPGSSTWKNPWQRPNNPIQNQQGLSVLRKAFAHPTPSPS